MEQEALKDVERKLPIVAALAETVAIKPLREVSVGDVCQKAQISRSTFYRMFSGVQDVILWHRNYGAELGLYQIGHTLTCYEGHLVSVGLIAGAKPLYTARTQSKANDEASFRTATTRSHVQAMREVLAQHCIDINSRCAYRLAGVAAACYAITSRWISHEMDLPVPVLAETLADVYPADLRKVFDRPLAPNPSAAAVKLLTRQA